VDSALFNSKILMMPVPLLRIWMGLTLMVVTSPCPLPRINLEEVEATEVTEGVATELPTEEMVVVEDVEAMETEMGAEVDVMVVEEVEVEVEELATIVVKKVTLVEIVLLADVTPEEEVVAVMIGTTETGIDTSCIFFGFLTKIANHLHQASTSVPAIHQLVLGVHGWSLLIKQLEETNNLHKLPEVLRPPPVKKDKTAKIVGDPGIPED